MSTDYSPDAERYADNQMLITTKFLKLGTENPD